MMKPITKNCITIGLALALGSSMLFSSAAYSQVNVNTLSFILNDSYRSVHARSQDADLKPLATLAFFGIEPDMQVVELWPNDGWYTEILAPYLKEEGQLSAAIYHPESRGSQKLIFSMANDALQSKMMMSKDWYGEVSYTAYEPDVTGLPSSKADADMVLSFDDVVHWTTEGKIQSVMLDTYAALRQGGIFGIVDNTENAQKSLGVDADRFPTWLVKLAEESGFVLIDSTNIKALTTETSLIAAYRHNAEQVPVVQQYDDTADDDLNAVASSTINSKHFMLKFIKPVNEKTLLTGSNPVGSSTVSASQQ